MSLVTGKEPDETVSICMGVSKNWIMAPRKCDA